MVQNMFYVLFFDQAQGDDDEVYVKKSYEERDYHGEIKMFYETSRAT